MEIIITNKEETGMTRCLALDITVGDGENIHEISTVLVEMYNSNNRTYDYEVCEFEWETVAPDPWEKLRIEEEVEKYILANTNNITN